jgi:hypothetical protein
MKKISIAIAFFAFIQALPFNVSAGSDNSMDPGLVDAIKVASSSYAKRLMDVRKMHDWEYADYVADIKNYSIGVSDGGSVYVVAFLIKGKDFNGGESIFYIRKQDLKILRVVYYK